MVLLEAGDRQDDRDGQGGRANGKRVADDVETGRTMSDFWFFTWSRPTYIGFIADCDTFAAPG
ncbi:hypothetical protein ACQP25_33155 [Microtetraspora malaysiensis]|uniref:hypothetical protein n=1 Tax=Microtetraspora malaysiensis TaxID=161358 RepID=UPI003D8DC4D5